MPKGTKKLGLSKMNFAGMGAPMMRKATKAAGGMSLEELFDSAREMGVKFVACTLSMDILGFNEDELIDGLEYAGVAAYLGRPTRPTSTCSSDVTTAAPWARPHRLPPGGRQDRAHDERPATA